MRKVFLFAAIAACVTANAGLWTAADDGYAYIGTPVDSFSVDFTTWTADSLPTSWLDADPAHEAAGMAFVKWTLTNRSVKYDGVSQSKATCFNNGTTADATPVKNNATTNKPRVYLPTTSRGVKKVKATIACAKARSLAVNYKDANHTSWTYTSSQVLNALASWAVTEVECELNTVGETTIFLQYGSTDYFSILALELVLVDNRSVSLDQHSVLMNADATHTLVATPLPADLELTWSSTDTAIVTVADGVVTAITAGEADIVVSGGDGITDTCHVVAVPHTGYAFGADGYWHYVGEPVDELDVEFSNLAEDQVYYVSGNVHAGILWNFSGIGLYKWCYLASRQCGTGDTYGPVLWNSGNSEHGTNYAIKDSDPDKLAAIYLPEIQNGIATLTVEGWTNNNSRGMMLEAENADGEWKPLSDFETSAENTYFNLLGNEYTVAEVTINSAAVKRLRMWRNSNDYQFITRIAVTPMDNTSTAIDKVQGDGARAAKILRDGQILILRGGETYDILGKQY